MQTKLWYGQRAAGTFNFNDFQMDSSTFCTFCSDDDGRCADPNADEHEEVKPASPHHGSHRMALQVLHCCCCCFWLFNPPPKKNKTAVPVLIHSSRQSISVGVRCWSVWGNWISIILQQHIPMTWPQKCNADQGGPSQKNVPLFRLCTKLFLLSLPSTQLTLIML